jgi:hypothetical protein
MPESKSIIVIPGRAGGSSTGQEQPAGEVSPGDVQLVSRLVVGLLLTGADELLSRLRAAQQRLEAGGGLAGADVIPDDETMAQVVGYLALGVAMRGQRRLARVVKRGLRLTTDAASRVLGTANRVTDNRLARPIRAPVERRMWELFMEGQAAIGEGRREVYASRSLSDETLNQLIEEVIQTVAENPELTGAIERVVAGQGVGLGGTMMGSARHLGVSADDATEGLVRRLLRRKPRRELPPSPLAGKPLTMYEPENPEQGAQDDG